MKLLDDRHVRVLAILLASLQDFTPPPATDRRNPLSVRQPSAGSSSLGPTEWETCPTCKGERRIKRGDAMVKCVRCEGRGGWHVDPYDNHRAKIHHVDLTGKDRQGRYIVPGVDEEPEGERAQAIRQAVRALSDYTERELDKALARCEQHGERDEEPIWVMLQKQARYRTGQRWARDLEAAMRLLPSFDQALLDVGLVTGWFPERFMGQPLRWRLAVALERLALVLPDTFKAPRSAVERASSELAAEQARDATARGRWAEPADRDARDREIRRLAGLDWSHAAIERRLGVSRRTVARVLDEREAA